MSQNVRTHDMDIVSSLHSGLLARVGRDIFDLWFASRTALELSGDTLVVRAQEPFTLERLRKCFGREIDAVCRQVLGPSVRVAFRLEPSAASTAAHSVKPEAPGCPAQPEPQAHTATGSGKATHPEPAVAKGEVRPKRARALDAIVVGEGNRIALTSARMVCRQSGEFSPLYVYGPPGCGKTQLLDALAQDIRQVSRPGRVVLLSAEQFTSHFIEALRGGGLPGFRRKYRDVQWLLIDDVQFFRGKRATLVELLHTVDSLLRQKRQLVLAADRTPAEAIGAGSDLAARMSAGLVCAIQPHEKDGRLEIARRFARQRGLEVPDDVLDLIAERLPGDARQIFGAMNRVDASSRAHQRPITLELAEESLEDIFRATRRVVRLADIDRAVCDVFGIEPQQLKAPRKARAAAGPRMLAMWLARKYTRAAYSEIGRHFGCRSHSTVISAQRKVSGWVDSGETIPLAAGDCRVGEALQRIEAHLRAC